MSVTFHTSVKQAENKKATGIAIPEDAIQTLGAGKKPAVTATLNGYAYRTTVAVMGGEYLIPLSEAHRKAAGLQAGDPVEVTLELDTAPRTVEVPADLLAALAAQARATERFEALSPSKRKECVRQVEDAKTEATRLKRIAAVLAQVSE
ncbi:YdeI/OmpD-associated family protein [Paenibacillus oryzisoli]|uniref:YdeI/OmpD-associated family protein n=1 Tax=Paenibacillus oryzisoli TaxID=1850517 RepID=UPI003D267BFF